MNNDLWWKGPQFMKKSDEMWSSNVEFASETEEKAEKEMKKSSKFKSVPAEVTVNFLSDKKLSSFNKVIDCEHFSNLHNIFRITAYVKRFIVDL